jgi:hypothetical protein
MSYLHSLCLSLPPVVCRRAHVLFTFFVFVCVYLQLFVGGLMSYLHSLCLFVVSNTFVLFVFFLRALCCCQFLILCFCFFFDFLVHPMLPFFLG